MRTFARITEHPSLLRDMRTQAILQTDSSLVRKHEARIMALQKEEARTAEIESIKSDVKEIKGMLQQLLTRA